MVTATPLFGTNTAPTVTGLTTLASDTNLLAGWQSGVIDGSTIDSLEAQWGFRFVANGTPTASRQVEIYGGACLDGPSGTLFAGSLTNAGPGAITLTAARKSQLELLRVLPSEAVASQALLIGGQSASQLWGGFPPRRYVFFIVHNLGVAFSAAAIYYDPINAES